MDVMKFENGDYTDGAERPQSVTPPWDYVCMANSALGKHSVAAGMVGKSVPYRRLLDA